VLIAIASMVGLSLAPRLGASVPYRGVGGG
jgi:hypothetical protein